MTATHNFCYVMAFTGTHAAEARNVLLSLLRVGALSEKTDVIVFTQLADAGRKLAAGLPTGSITIRTLTLDGIDAEYDEAAYGTRLFAQITACKIFALTTVLRERPQTHIIWLDTDLFFFADPRPRLVEQIELHPGAIAHFQVTHLKLCTGFMVMPRNTNRQKRRQAQLSLLNDTHALLLKMLSQPTGPKMRPMDDEDCMNQVVAEQAIDVNLLPRAIFPNGEDFFDMHMRGPQTVLVHNNFIRGLDAKIARFKDHGFWLVDSDDQETTPAAPATPHPPVRHICCPKGLQSLHTAIEQFASEEIVLVSHRPSVSFQCTQDTLRAAFQNLETDIVVSGSDHSIVSSMEAFYPELSAEDSTRRPFRFASAWAFIGKVGAIRRFIQEAIDIGADPIDIDLPNIWSWIAVSNIESPDMIRVDDQALLFEPVCRTNQHATLGRPLIVIGSHTPEMTCLPDTQLAETTQTALPGIQHAEAIDVPTADTSLPDTQLAHTTDVHRPDMTPLLETEPAQTTDVHRPDMTPLPDTEPAQTTDVPAAETAQYQRLVHRRFGAAQAIIDHLRTGTSALTPPTFCHRWEKYSLTPQAVYVPPLIMDVKSAEGEKEHRPLEVVALFPASGRRCPEFLRSFRTAGRSALNVSLDEDDVRGLKAVLDLTRVLVLGLDQDGSIPEPVVLAALCRGVVVVCEQGPGADTFPLRAFVVWASGDLLSAAVAACRDYDRLHEHVRAAAVILRDVDAAWVRRADAALGLGGALSNGLA
jgi:hypothetical protein